VLTGAAVSASVGVGPSIRKLQPASINATSTALPQGRK